MQQFTDRVLGWHRKTSCTGLLTIKIKYFFGIRPPYANDPIWENYEIIGKVPANPLQNMVNSRYFDCFSALPKDPHKAISKYQN